MRRKLNLERVYQQEGLEPIPDSPEKGYIARERDRVAALAPELKAERWRIVSDLCRIALIEEKWGVDLQWPRSREWARQSLKSSLPP